MEKAAWWEEHQTGLSAFEDLLLGGAPKVYINPDLNPAPPVQDVNALPCF